MASDIELKSTTSKSRQGSPVDRHLAKSKVGADDEIIWQYLTFDTELPAPSLVSHASGTMPTTPDPPNLKKYTSPFLWSYRRKLLTTIISVTATLLSAFAPGSYIAGEIQMRREWGLSVVALSVGISVYTWGFAIAPMMLAPLSEINGRRPLFLITGAIFVLSHLVCAVTPTFAGMVIARLIGGLAGSTFSTVVGGVVSDIYHAKDRNTPMTLFSGAAIFCSGFGPAVGGLIGYHTTWRWIFWLQVIISSTVILVMFFVFKETRGSVLLSRKAKALNKWYEEMEAAGYYGVLIPPDNTPHRIRWKVKADEERGSLGIMIGVSLYRPFHLLVTEPVVFFFSLWISFAWSVLYLMFSAIPLVFQAVYHFNLMQYTAVFASISVAAIISTVMSIYQESLARRLMSTKRLELLDSPEGRLYFCCIQSILLPIGCFWFGWTSFSSIHWIVPTLAIGCATMGIFSIYLAVFNYLADTYHRYASSALAAQSFCRNMMGGSFPLFTRQMFTAMKFHGAGSFLGGFSALLTIIPWILIFYGPQIRARSKFASEIMH
ncbi:putative MFS multidrug transporter [Piedraia hortae CBS 480.64]|uniref:Putative MFS multidrug transporter n=1 Tax=Piedraia hortae CBS 480.64 TaxID=1314780 RepID=A0A6A7C7Z2_9PEZI|nr:putative MFS multidrug transporter [Piedraia hortae CBS 480.64]